MGNPFITSFDPPIGVAEELMPGLRRIVAPNPSPMTFRGTNTYLLGTQDVAVIDPGPDDPDHLAAILDAVEASRGATVSHILVTHSHLDHSPLAARLSEATGAPVLAKGLSEGDRSPEMAALAAAGGLGGGEGIDRGFRPAERLAAGDRLGGAEWVLEVIETPGHLADHLCFAWGDRVFTGDHVMSWATTMVSPPDGDLSDFMASLERLAARVDDRHYLPGHGVVLDDPIAMVHHQIAHRQGREAQILAELAAGPATPAALTARIYTDIPAALLPAAERNVLSHLIDLKRKSRVDCEGLLTSDSVFHLT